MCLHCEKGKPLESEWANYTIEGNKLFIYYNAYSVDSSFEEEVEINFCPICGKRLE